MGGSVIYGWGMRNGSMEDIERIVLLVSKNRHVVGVFIPTNPSPNCLLILGTNITILISTSIKVFLQHQVHRITRPAQPTSTSRKPQFPSQGPLCHVTHDMAAGFLQREGWKNERATM